MKKIVMFCLAMFMATIAVTSAQAEETQAAANCQVFDQVTAFSSASVIYQAHDAIVPCASYVHAKYIRQGNLTEQHKNALMNLRQWRIEALGQDPLPADLKKFVLAQGPAALTMQLLPDYPLFKSHFDETKRQVLGTQTAMFTLMGKKPWALLPQAVTGQASLVEKQEETKISSWPQAKPTLKPSLQKPAETQAPEEVVVVPAPDLQIVVSSDADGAGNGFIQNPRPQVLPTPKPVIPTLETSEVQALGVLESLITETQRQGIRYVEPYGIKSDRIAETLLSQLHKNADWEQVMGKSWVVTAIHCQPGSESRLAKNSTLVADDLVKSVQHKWLKGQNGYITGLQATLDGCRVTWNKTYTPGTEEYQYFIGPKNKAPKNMNILSHEFLKYYHVLEGVRTLPQSVTLTQQNKYSVALYFTKNLITGARYQNQEETLYFMTFKRVPKF